MKKFKKTIKSPFSNCYAALKSEYSMGIEQYFYECNKTKEKFDTPDTLSYNLNKLKGRVVSFKQVSVIPNEINKHYSMNDLGLKWVKKTDDAEL